ncbi:hypothetical protein BJV82DRAFT_634701 [Fennellomyces sp. T-0311]|nr:hypothetical protein BJV82DRAFT_634701 [Fennellomyces sp. T-0311]
MTEKCPYPECNNRGLFKSSFALDQHITAMHSAAPLPISYGNISPASTQPTIPGPQADSASFPQYMECDYTDYDEEPDQSAQVPIEKNYQRTTFEQAIVGASERRVIKRSLCTTGKDLAVYALDHGLSTAEYAQIAKIVQQAFDEGHASTQHIMLQVNTMGKMKQILNSDADPCATIPFEYYDLDLGQIEDFPYEHEATFREAVHSLTLGYRNIVDLCQHLFSHPAFSKEMILSARQWNRGGTRVYGDVDSGTWWEDLQNQLPDHYVVLSIILASDQTVVSGNFRHKAWPVYLTLGNIPASTREKLKNNARRVLAFLPCIDWNGPTATAPSWFVAAKHAVIHHCLKKILAYFKSEDGSVPAYELKGPEGLMYRCVPALACYMADLPEQRLLSIVRSGTSTYTCPRCLVPTCLFHAPYDWPGDGDNASSIQRTETYMKSIYEIAKSYQLQGEKQKMAKVLKDNSTHMVKNAFWDMPLFDIYKALSVDDLHQLGGIYKHLVQCIERMLLSQNGGSLVIKQINQRASFLSPFPGLHAFKSGYMISFLKNPTFSELKSHMAIFLSCVHDLIPLQMAIAIRHFIDFFQQAVAKEHSERTLAEMDQSLLLFSRYNAIFEQWSPSNLQFPKLHALWKYSSDIRKYGVIGNYSTNHSERQHRTDAKKPAERVNYASEKFVEQLGSYIYYRDLLSDQYWEECTTLWMADKARIDNNTNLPSFTLESHSDNGLFLPLQQILLKDPTYKSLETLTRTYLDYCLGNNYPKQLKKYPRFSSKVRTSGKLSIVGKDIDGDIVYDTVRASPNFYGATRYDFVLLRKSSNTLLNGISNVGQVLLFYTIESINGDGVKKNEDLCLIRLYERSSLPHASGLQPIITPTDSISFEGLSVKPVSMIAHAIHVVPDFSTALNGVESEGPYEQYLINHDISPRLWSLGNTNLPMLEDDEGIWWNGMVEQQD